MAPGWARPRSIPTSSGPSSAPSGKARISLQGEPVLGQLGDVVVVELRGRLGPVVGPRRPRHEPAVPVLEQLDLLPAARERERVALGTEDELVAVVRVLLARVQPERHFATNVLRGPTSAAFIRAICPSVNMIITSSST